LDNAANMNRTFYTCKQGQEKQATLFLGQLLLFSNGKTG
jgi:hypothetical protein